MSLCLNMFQKNPTMTKILPLDFMEFNLWKEIRPNIIRSKKLNELVWPVAYHSSGKLIFPNLPLKPFYF